MPLPNRSLLLQLFKLPCQSFSSIILEAALEKRESDTLAQRHHAPGAIMRHHYQSSLKLFDFNLFHIFLLFHLQWDDASNDWGDGGQSWCSAVPFAQLCQHQRWRHDADTYNWLVSAEFTFLRPCSWQITSRITWTLKHITCLQILMPHAQRS